MFDSHRAPQSDTSSSLQRRRSFDPDFVSRVNPSTFRSVAIRSRDGSRWLPTPDEQSRREDRGEPTETVPAPVEAPPLSQHACSAPVCAVIKAFETTELLECILSFLDTTDVLSLRRTGRQWNTTVQSSPYLRLHFFTYPQWERPTTEYQLLPVNLSGVVIEAGEPIHLGQWVKASMTLQAAKRICPEPRQRVRARSIFEGLRGGLGRSSSDAWPGSTPATPATGGVKYEDLKIVQPPLLGMQAYIIRGDSALESAADPATSLAAMSLDAGAPAADEGHPAVAKLSCDSGITLGFLAETTHELLGSQTGGSSSASGTRVEFRAIISFCANDASARRTSRRNLRTVTRIG